MADLKKTRPKHFATALAILALVAGGWAIIEYRRQGQATISHDPIAAPVTGDPETLELPERSVQLTRLKTAVALTVTRPRLLQLRGSLAIDPNRLVHVHPRFPGQIVELATVEDPADGASGAKPVRRPVMFMDRVNKNQIVGIIWSKDLGEKKSELVDALARLRLDKQTLAALKDLETQGATPPRAVREAERAVEVGFIAVSRAERTLRSWNIGEEDIEEIRQEADRIHRGLASDKRQDAEWARLELVAPIAGTVVEKNVTVGDIVDTNTDIFKIADLSRLSLWLHVYEEDLPYLLHMAKPIHVRMRLPSSPDLGEMPATVDRIGEIIDPNEHMALLLGSISNPRGDLCAGQFVTATIEIPPEPGAVEIPAKALVDDGDSTLVFVQEHPKATEYTRRRVSVMRRYHDVVYVRSEPTPAERDQGMHGLRPGEVVVASGALELEAKLEQKQSEDAGEHK